MTKYTSHIFLCKSVDEFVPENRWIASLSNGETIFEDRHPNLPPAWARLSEYVKKNRLAITQLRAQIAGTMVNLPPNQEAYIQYKKAISTGSRSDVTMCIGFVQGSRAKIFQISSANKSSRTLILPDPGEPKSIYKCNTVEFLSSQLPK